MRIAGPARSLVRVEPQEVRQTTVRALYGDSGPALAVQARFVRESDGKQFLIEIGHAEWEILRGRLDRAFVFPE